MEDLRTGRRIVKTVMCMSGLDLYERRQVCSVDGMSSLKLGDTTACSRFHQLKRVMITGNNFDDDIHTARLEYFVKLTFV